MQIYSNQMAFKARAIFFSIFSQKFYSEIKPFVIYMPRNSIYFPRRPSVRCKTTLILNEKKECARESPSGFLFSRDIHHAITSVSTNFYELVNEGEDVKSERRESERRSLTLIFIQLAAVSSS